MTIPIFEEGLQIAVKMRNLGVCDKNNRFIALKGSRQGLFNYDAVYLQPGVTFIVKGEIPAALLTQMGYLAVAPTGGEGGWRESWRTALALCRREYEKGWDLVI